MSIWGHRVSVKLVAGATVFLVIGAMLAAVGLGPERPFAPAREITLVARGMAFYVEGDPTPNPTITVHAGERVRIVLRNEERGLRHDIAVPAIDAALDPLGWREQGSVTFAVPDEPGRYEYHCRPHALMMRGTLVVAAAPDRDA